MSFMNAKEITIKNIEMNYHNSEMSTTNTYDVIQANKGVNCINVKSGIITTQKLNSIHQSKRFDLDDRELQKQLLSCDKAAKKHNCFFDACLKQNVNLLVFNDLKSNQQSLSFLRIILRNRKGEIFFEDLPLTSYPDENVSIIFDQLLKRSTEKIERITSYSDQSCIILAPKAASFFVHEIVGHQCEYDLASSTNAYINVEEIGKKVLPYNANIISDPFMKNFMDLGSLDDDGVRLEQQMIVENGHLKGFINSRRCDSYYHNTMYRMTNLCLLANPEGATQEGLINRSSESVLVNSFVYGGYNAEINQFTLYSNDAYLIKNQKRIARISQFIIQQDITKIETMIQEIGNDMHIYLSICSKLGQSIFVCNGSPSLAVKL